MSLPEPPSRPLPIFRARWRRVWLALIALVAVLAGIGFSGVNPVPLPEIEKASLPCVSYAPFRRTGHTPFDPGLHIPPEAIEADLRLLATVTSCIRTYGVDHGLDAVPEIARKLGLRVILGAWIGRDPKANQRQLRQALALTHTHRDVIDLLIVGNEVLLRRELEPAALGELLASARREAAVPVSYADVWAFWERHAEALIPYVDVISIHILPYWEDEPAGIDAAVDHVYRINKDMERRFAGQPVFVAETGWPAAGRQRGPAAPGRFEQARFIREMLARRAVEPLRFNVIEGFDQPWKRRLEGEMGGAWGMFDSRGEMRLPLTGPVRPEPFFGALRWLSVPDMPPGSPGWFEWGGGLGLFVVALLCMAAAARRLFVLGRNNLPATNRLLTAMLTLLLGLLAIDALWLTLDGRYHPLRWELAAIPLPFLLGLVWLGDGLPVRRSLQRLLAAVTAFAALGVVGSEGLANTQAVFYGGLLASLALASLFLFRVHRAVTPSSMAGKSCIPPSA